MSVHIDDQTYRGYLARIISAPDEASRHEAADAMIVALHKAEVLEIWGRSLTSRYGRPHDEWEEITAVLTEAILQHIRSFTADDLAKVRTVGSHLFFRGKEAVTRWLDSPAVTFASEMSGISRRNRIAGAAIRELRSSLGREPEVQEVVNFVNSRALENRKNAVKQGALITAADVDGAMLHTYSIDYSTDDEKLRDSFGTPDDGNVTVQAEVALTVSQLGALASTLFGPERGAEVQATLTLWVSHVLAQEPVTAVAVSLRFGISRRAAVARLGDVNRLMEAFRAAHDE